MKDMILFSNQPVIAGFNDLIKMIKLRLKAKKLGIRGFTLMKKQELEKAIEKAKTEAKYYEIFCDSCLEERKNQRLIDVKMYNKQKLAKVIRDYNMRYKCKHTRIAYNINERICVDCGEILIFEMNQENDYFSHKIKNNTWILLNNKDGID